MLFALSPTDLEICNTSNFWISVGINFVQYLPDCVLLITNNKLSSLPGDIGSMKNLMELNASCNEISYLPKSLGQLKCLKALDLRKNLLEELPIELTYLKLTLLDMSENRISSLPVELRLMTYLEQLKLNDNPLISPPATICMRGRVHIFKFLETQVNKTDKKRGGGFDDSTGKRNHQRKSDLRYPNGVASEMRVKRHTVDSGYSTSDGIDPKWAQDFRCGDGVNKTKLKTESIPVSNNNNSNGDRLENINGSHSGCSTPSTISPGESFSNDDELINRTVLFQDQLEAKRLIRLQSNDRGLIVNKSKEKSTTKGSTNGETLSPVYNNSSPIVGNNFNFDDKKKLEHVQTYREYKEARRLQRAQTQDVYKIKYSNEGQQWANQSPTSENSNDDLSTLNNQFNHSKNNNNNNSSSNGNGNNKPIQKVIPSRNSNYGGNSLANGETSSIPSYVKPSSPVKGSTTTLLTETLSKPSLSPLSGGRQTSNMMASPINSSMSRFRTNSNSPKPMKWNTDIPADKLSFTMRREFEKAKEEAELIEQLRNHIEGRLKMSLPEEMGPALMDGVVLCHLANHVRPRSVASIHVPSPAVPKLTMARCRRNVDNFLDACRKIGVEENMICFASDVLEGRGLVRVSITVAELLKFHTPKSPAHNTVP
ncbi:calponin homology domain containing protein, putative [Pediculus humanus corporis]|uniref:Calponin homology domain containing protein, putative n=1 Tax=Pediculus humanus subsp. corporis TaxID=121224 RepID=E0W252_PEDHC|nr:calponin homology domain containing protein, putative [Pediculus humanus corporis]EEB19708.1 calponin homology domain containing protein, putative [Pediculus humanus corporis]